MGRSRRPGMVIKFALYSFFVFVACGMGLSYVIGRYVQPGSFRIVAPAVGGALTFLYFAQLAVVKAASKAATRKFLDLQQSSDEQAAGCETLKANYTGTLVLLDRALGARDQVTGAYSGRLTKIAHKMGGRLGLSPDAHRRIEYGSQFHDIGNIGIPDVVLQKPGRLSAEETAEMRKHPRLGAEILRSVPFLADVADIVEHHHERFDGTGYPDGLARGDIPIEARILSVIDVFDDMTRDRPQRPAVASDAAVKELIKGRGSQFDPGVVDLFLLYLAEDEGVTLPPEGEDELRRAA